MINYNLRFRNKLILITLGLLFYSVFFQMISKIGKTNEVMAGNKQYVKSNIIYNDKGFSPSKLKIKKGTTVIFINTSSNLLWVGSNPHPQHTDYPEFDSLKGLLSKTKYQFTFDKKGNWGYHNHLRPKHKGMIIVY